MDCVGDGWIQISCLRINTHVQYVNNRVIQQRKRVQVHIVYKGRIRVFQYGASFCKYFSVRHMSKKECNVSRFKNGVVLRLTSRNPLMRRLYGYTGAIRRICRILLVGLPRQMYGNGGNEVA